MSLFSETRNKTDNDNSESIFSSSNVTPPEDNLGYEKIPDFLRTLDINSDRLQPAALHQGIDFLQLEGTIESDRSGLTPSRNWADDLCYGTGTSYLVGLTLGGAVGLAEELKKGSDSMKVRLNTTLNTMTRRGPGIGNAVGVLAMVYNGTTATLDVSRGHHDVFNSMAGGAVSGVVFKSTSGPRMALVSAAVCSTIAGAWSFFVSNFLNK